MSDRVFRVLYSYFLIPGVMLGISLRSGVDVSELGIASLILDAVCEALQSPACMLSPVFKLVGILMTVIPFAVLFFIGDYVGLVLGFLFFLSGMFLVFIPTIGTILLIFLVALTLLIGLTEKSGKGYGGVV